MLNKYIYVNQETYKASGKQNKDGIWICEKMEVVAKDKKELSIRYRDGIDAVNKIHNDFNRDKKETKAVIETTPPVKGLK